MLLLATIAIALPSCSDDKDEPDAGIKENIIGTWKGIAAKVDGSWVDITKYPFTSLGLSATFHSNGTYYGSGALGTGSGTYKIKGNTIETYVGGELYLKYKVKSVTTLAAELTIIDGKSTMDVRVRKSI